MAGENSGKCYRKRGIPALNIKEREREREREAGGKDPPPDRGSTGLSQNEAKDVSCGNQKAKAMSTANDRTTGVHGEKGRGVVGQ